MSEEDWFKSTVFDTLKVRASYGELGNQQIGGSNLALNISLIDENTAFYAYNGSGGATFGATIAAKGNPNLTWENQISTNFALDMGFLDNKLQATIDVFKIETSDLVAQDTNLFSSTAIDASAPFRNIGSMEVTGFDASISYSDETSSGFKWSTGLNLTKADNEVTELINEYFTGIGRRVGPVTRTEVGQPISYFYGRNVIGIFQDASEVASHASQVGAAPGRFKYEDVNNDGIINDDDRTKLGSPHPDLIFGLNFNFEYKNWDMSMFVNGTLGNEVFDNTALFYETPTFFNSNRSTRVLDSWSPSNPDASFPALSETVQNNEFSVSNSFFVRDGSYLRLRSLQVGYTLPSNIASKIGASFARIYYNCTNLLTLTDFPGLDPDVPTGGTLNIGVYDSQYPTRSLSSIGVNLRF